MGNNGGTAWRRFEADRFLRDGGRIEGDADADPPRVNRAANGGLAPIVDCEAPSRTGPPDRSSMGDDDDQEPS